MTVNRSSFESDKKPTDTVSKTIHENGAAKDNSVQQDGTHSIQLDTYFSEERVHIPDKVSVLFIVIDKTENSLHSTNLLFSPHKKSSKIGRIQFSGIVGICWTRFSNVDCTAGSG